MHFDQSKGFFRSLIAGVRQSLPMLFWMLLLFGFDTPYFAMCTLISAAVHELGHVLALHALNLKNATPQAHISGFRIYPERCLSFREDIAVSLAGPLSNLVFAAACAALAPALGDYLWTLALFGAMTAASNLAPIEGYDGYRLLLALTSSRFPYFERVLKRISFSITATLTLLSLYFIDKLGTGYWIYAVFTAGMIAYISKSQKQTFFKD